jgi:hypothetical protein
MDKNQIKNLPASTAASARPSHPSLSIASLASERDFSRKERSESSVGEARARTLERRRDAMVIGGGATAQERRVKSVRLGAATFPSC